MFFKNKPINWSSLGVQIKVKIRDIFNANLLTVQIFYDIQQYVLKDVPPHYTGISCFTNVTNGPKESIHRRSNSCSTHKIIGKYSRQCELFVLIAI